MPFIWPMNYFKKIFLLTSFPTFAAVFPLYQSVYILKKEEKDTINMNTNIGFNS